MSPEQVTGDHLSIGEVLAALHDEFPDITISKIRFLESQGLVDPERTPSGYRKFYGDDVTRLRWILFQQKENFLPLKVIKDRLEQLSPSELARLDAEAPDGPGDPADDADAGQHDDAGASVGRRAGEPVDAPEAAGSMVSPVEVPVEPAPARPVPARAAPPARRRPRGGRPPAFAPTLPLDDDAGDDAPPALPDTADDEGLV